MRLVAGPVRDEHRRRVSVALRAAERISGRSREELQEILDAEPRLLSLKTRLLFAAGMNGHDETLGALGVALGTAVRNPEWTDECELILSPLSDLAPDHIHVLRVLDSPPPESKPTRVSRWVRENVAATSDLPLRLTDLCLATLVGRGMVRQPTVGNGEAPYVITKLGRSVLEVLAELAARDDDEPQWVT